MPAESHREGGRSGEGGNYVDLDHLHGHGHHERAEDAGLQIESRRVGGFVQDQDPRPHRAPQPPMLGPERLPVGCPSRVRRAAKCLAADSAHTGQTSGCGTILHPIREVAAPVSSLRFRRVVRGLGRAFLYLSIYPAVSTGGGCPQRLRHVIVLSYHLLEPLEACREGRWHGESKGVGAQPWCRAPPPRPMGRRAARRAGSAAPRQQWEP
eukprot:scaffold113651_cov60-Phaeocystis_antarctica.AAC.2